ncbi:MAG: hypothetical protein AAF591_14255 [Verrucomicrobiota bacterium]
MPRSPSITFWKIWANPIFRRYCQSRLRPRGLGFTLLITLILAAFLFFIFRFNAIYNINIDLIDAERAPIIPLLFLQGVILFLLGTGQVAGGMTAESDEGVLDYQRLAPMSPLAKVVGYLFGLPIREYVCFAATMPFTLWALWRGMVEWQIAAQLYLVFLSSAILYHLTGLVAGTVIKNKRWAFLASMGLVFLLYTVMPQVSNFGLAYFRHLTLYPVFEEYLAFILPRDQGALILAGRSLLGVTRFFDLNLSETFVTLFSQGILSATLVSMLCRRWRRAESHLLGKIWATVLFAWIQIALLGNALPLIRPGQIFPSNEFNRRFVAGGLRENWSPEPAEVIAMAGTVGFVSLAILWTFTAIITPNKFTQLNGWRRARKKGRSSLGVASDPATALPWVAFMTACGAAGWILFTRAIVESRWFPGTEISPITTIAFILVFFTGGIGFQTLLESKGARTTVLVAILLGVVPLLLGSVLATISAKLTALATPAIWIIALSPVAAPSYAAITTLDIVNLPLVIARALPNAFWFSQGIAALITLYLLTHLRHSRRTIKNEA